MALINMFGFDHFKQGSNLSAALSNMTSLACGLSLGSGFESNPLGPQLTMSNSSTISFTEMTLSNGKKRTFLTQGGSNSYIRFTYPTTQLLTLPRDGKWYMGYRVFVNTTAYAANYIVAQCRFGSGAITITIPAAGTYYVEVEVNWKTNTVITYLNGVVQNTYTGTSYVDPAVVAPYNYMSPYSQANNVTTVVVGMTDYYFVVEAANDPSPLAGRLGPIIVKPLPFASVVNGERFAPPAGQTFLDTINLTTSNIGAVTGDVAYATANRIVKTSANGEIATLSASVPSETQAIVAVQLNTLSHKLQAAAAGTQQQVKQGTATGIQDRTVPGLVTAPTGKTFTYTKALDGAVWTNEKVGQIKLSIGSYRP